MTPWQEAVYTMVRCIPRGKVMTYGQVARELGKPLSSRAVGQALARNPFPYNTTGCMSSHTKTPCHRVIQSNGAVGGFNGRRHQKEKKIALLEREGVCIEAGKVTPLERFLAQL